MIADRYLQLKTELESGLTGLIRLGSELKRAPTELDTLQALFRDISEPLLFVVVGEVKSGKSSLLNALFGSEFAKVDVLPATDRVYLFRYGTEEKTTEVSQRLSERSLPIPFLRHFNIVDTPGTNSMVKEHQMTTEEFMPRADVVLFVFSVVNPWTQSNWDFLNFLQKTWLKNVIFVLQQIDLREPTEIDIIHRHLQDTALRQLGFVPPIFAISARKALLARTSGVDKERLWQESAFGPLEDQINFIVTESSTRMLKLRSTFQAARVAMNDFSGEIQTLLGKIAVDEAALARLDALLQTRRDQLRRQIGSLVRDIESGYDQTARQRTYLLQQNITAWSAFGLIAGRKNAQRSLLERVEAKLRDLMQPQIDRSVSALETDLRTVWPQMQDLLDHQLSAELRKEARPSIPDFAGQRRELYEAIQRAFLDILTGKSLHARLGRSFRRTAIAMRIATALIVSGGAAAAWEFNRNMPVAIAAAGVAVAGLLFAMFLAFDHRRRIFRDYEHELDPKRPEFKQALESQFGKAIDAFCAEMSQRFEVLREHCQNRRDRCEPWSRQIADLQTTFGALKPRLG
jgi:small GTP-binding protein